MLLDLHGLQVEGPPRLDKHCNIVFKLIEGIALTPKVLGLESELRFELMVYIDRKLFPVYLGLFATLIRTVC